MELELRFYYITKDRAPFFDEPNTNIEFPISNEAQLLSTWSSGVPRYFLTYIKGIIIGIQQQLLLMQSLDICQFGIEIKTHLFIQLISKYLLANGYNLCIIV